MPPSRPAAAAQPIASLATLARAAVLALAGCLALPAISHAQTRDAARETARKALESNPELSARMQAYLGRDAAIAEAKAAWKPRLDAHARGGIDNARYRGVTGNSRIRHAGGGLTLTQLLWDGFATSNEVDRVGHERLARWFEFIDASEQTSLEALRAMYDVQRQRKLVALAEDNVNQHVQTAQKIESRVKAGVGRGVDMDQVRARLAMAQSNLDTEVANLHDVAARYMRIVGEPPISDVGALEPLRGTMPGSAPEAVQHAIERSPLVAAAIEGVRAARSAEKGRRSAFQPRVEAFAEAGAGRNLNATRDRASEVAVGVQLNWNLYAGGADEARQKQAAIFLQQTMDQRDKACRDVRQAVSIAWQEHAKLTSQMGSLARNTAAIDRARDAYRQQFDIGQRSLLDLLNAESESYTARRSVTGAVFDRAVAAARTLAAMNQLNAELGLARETLPPEAKDWQAGQDTALKCPAQAVDMNSLRQGIDASLPWVQGAAQPPVVADPVASQPVPPAPVAMTALPVEHRPVMRTAALAPVAAPKAVATKTVAPKAVAARPAAKPAASKRMVAAAGCATPRKATRHVAAAAPAASGDQSVAKALVDKARRDDPLLDAVAAAPCN